MAVSTGLVIRRHQYLLVSPQQSSAVSSLFVAASHVQGVVRADFDTEAAEHAAPCVELHLVHDILVVAILRGYDPDDAVRTALGTSGASGAEVTAPYELLPSNPP